MKNKNGSIFNRSDKLEKIVKTLYNPELSYHNFQHVINTLYFGTEIIQDCLKENIPVNAKVVYLAILFHDAGYFEDHIGLGFKTKEAYSAALAEKTLTKENYSSPEIYEIKNAILSTEKNASFESAEQQVVRAADLSGMAADYNTFLINSINLKNEYEFLSGSKISWENWKTATISTVEEYISSEIPLTEYFKKRGGESPFEKGVRKNLRRLHRETIRPEIPNRF